jgi:hypothetical protein
MSAATKRATIYLDTELHRALRLKAVQLDHSVSDLVNEAVRTSLAEDALDLAAFTERKREKSGNFESVLKKLKARGKI